MAEDEQAAKEVVAEDAEMKDADEEAKPDQGEDGEERGEGEGEGEGEAEAEGEGNGDGEGEGEDEGEGDGERDEGGDHGPEGDEPMDEEHPDEGAGQEDAPEDAHEAADDEMHDDEQKDGDRDDDQLQDEEEGQQEGDDQGQEADEQNDDHGEDREAEPDAAPEEGDWGREEAQEWQEDTQGESAHPADAMPEEGDWGREDDDDMGREEEQEEQGEAEGGKEEKAKDEEKPWVESEEDAPEDERPKIAAGAFACSKDSTLNLMTSCGGKLLMHISDGGFQYLLAGVRASAGLKSGRYLFEVKVVEVRHIADSSSKQRVPRQVCSLGFSTAGSSLLLGEEAESIGFDTEGNFIVDGRATYTNDRIKIEQQMVLGVLLNLSSQSPNANTVSLFVNGTRVGKPSPLPENLKGKALFPTVNFKNLTLQANFTGVCPFAPLPFTCRTLQDAAEEDVEAVPVAAAGDEKSEVLFPIGLPDEGTFSWLDSFEEKSKYTELSGRALLKMCSASGLRKIGDGQRRSCNDRPTMQFGLKELDDGTARRLMQSVAPVLRRNYIVMEVQKNLLSDERRKALSIFDSADYKRVALVVMGEPPEQFKVKVHEQMLAEKKQKVAAEVKRAKRPSKWSEGGDEDGKKALTPEELAEEVKKAEDGVELTEQEKEVFFMKSSQEDLSRKELSQSFGSFSLPSEDEGFDEIRFVWQGEEECKEYLKKWVSEKKLTQRVEDLKPGDWFKEQQDVWHRTLSSWKRRCEDWKDPVRRKRMEEEKRRKKEEDGPLPVGPIGKEDGDDTVVAVEEEEKTEVNGTCVESVDDTDLWMMKEPLEIGTGEPLFSQFTWEDWMMLQLRFDLHLLVHAYRQDMNDPERESFHESHTEFYYERYFKKPLGLKNYGVESIMDLLQMVKDTIEVLPKNSVLDAQLSDDTPLENFIRLTEDQRRVRLGKLDVGDNSAALRLVKPNNRDGHQSHRGSGGGHGSRGNQNRQGGYSQASRAPPRGPVGSNTSKGGGGRGGSQGRGSGGYSNRSGGGGQRGHGSTPPATSSARGHSSSYGGSGGQKRSHDHGSGGGRDGGRDAGRRDGGHSSYKSQRTSYSSTPQSSSRGGSSYGGHFGNSSSRGGSSRDKGKGGGRDHSKGGGRDHGKGSGRDHGKGGGRDHGKGGGRDHGKGGHRR